MAEEYLIGPLLCQLNGIIDNFSVAIVGFKPTSLALTTAARILQIGAVGHSGMTTRSAPSNVFDGSSTPPVPGGTNQDYFTRLSHFFRGVG